MSNLSSIKDFLRRSAAQHPRLLAVYEFYTSLLEIAYTDLPDDLRPWVREFSADDPTPMFNIRHLDPSLLPHAQETYRKVLNLVETQAPHGRGDTAFCLKWALKPSFIKLLESLVLKMEPTDRIHCPLCGGRPFMAIVPEGEIRILSCGFCGYRWEFASDACLSCGNREKAKMGFFVGEDGGRSGYRAETCELCKTYLKTVYKEVQSTGMDDMDVEDFVTLPLDLLAQSRGYRNLPSVLVI